MKKAWVMRCNRPATHPPTPRASIMNPSWLTVSSENAEYRSARAAMVAAMSVIAPV